MGIFGRKSQPSQGQPSQAPLQGHEALPLTPFGEDITHPDSQTMPPEFHGLWVRDLSASHPALSPTRQIISSDQIVIGEVVQRVVAVRYIDTGQVAVVTLPLKTDQMEYSLFYFGLSEDGNTLVDLENMDWILYRCPTQATSS